MLKKTRFDALTYVETTTAREFTSKPQGALNVGRWASGQSDYWPKITPAGTVGKKTLIVADWWAESWEQLMRSQVNVLLAELMGEGFKIYVWQDQELILLDDLHLLNDHPVRQKITPEFKDVLISQALLQLKLPQDKVAIIHRAELEGLLGNTPDEIKTISASYLAHTIHDIEKIKAVEDSQTLPFKKTRLEKIADHYPRQSIKETIRLNWPDVELTEDCQALALTNSDNIHLNEQGTVGINTSDKNIPVNHLSYLYLDMEEPDKTSATKVAKLLTPALKGLHIPSYPVDDSAFDIFTGNMTNLEYLNLGQCPAETGLKIIRASRLKHLIADMNEYSDDAPVTIFDSTGENDQSFSQLSCLTLSLCHSYDLERVLRHEMPKLRSLLLTTAILENTFNIQHPLNKLLSLEIGYLCSAGCLESLLQSAMNCNQLKLVDVTIKGAFSPGFHLAKINRLELGSTPDFTKEVFAASEAILNVVPALKTLTINGNIANYQFMHSVDLPQLETLNMKNPVQISLETLGTVLMGMPNLNTLTMTDIQIFNLDENLAALLASIKTIHLSTYTTALPSIKQHHDIPGLKSIELTHGNKNMDPPTLTRVINLFKSASGLKTLLLGDYHSGFMFTQQVSFPDSVESLTLEGKAPSADTLKKMLVAMPRLQHLTLKIMNVNDPWYQEWLADTALQNLLKNIKHVSSPQFIKPHTNTTRADEYINTSKPDTVDADTSMPANKPEFNLTRIFEATTGNEHPKPLDYRLVTYNRITLSAEPGIKQPFILHNTEDLELIPCAQIRHADDIQKLGKEVLHEGHLGQQTFNLDTRWRPIASLSATDHISHYHISGNPAGCEISYSKRDNLYYIRSRTGSQTITLDFLVKSPAGPTPDILSPKIKTWVNLFRSFGAGKLILKSEHPSSEEYLNAILEQKVGACRHRSAAFKALMAQEHPEIPVRVVNNDCHSFVELNQAGHWIRCDLGGYPATLNVRESALKKHKTPRQTPVTHTEMRYVSEQQREYERQFETWEMDRNTRADNAKLYFQNLLTGQNKKQLIHVPEHEITALNIAIQTQAMHTSHPVFYIHSPEDLVCSAPVVIRDESNHGSLHAAANGGGPLHDFLTAPRDHTRLSPILIVNYARFSADDIVRFNGLLDEARHADGTPLPQDAVVIGLIDPDKADAYRGADFYSRFDAVEQCPLTTIPPIIPVLIPLNGQEIPSSESVQINLFHASNWLTELMGGWTLQEGQLYFEEGKLTSAIQSGRPIEIQNPPQDSAFEVFWQQARLRGFIDYAGVSYPFPKHVQCYSREGYDWQALQTCITWSENTPSTALVLNPSNLNDFSNQYQFDQEGVFSRIPGLFAEHAAKHPEEPLDILVTRSLSHDEWGRFLNESQQHSTLKLTLSCSPGVTLPEELGHPLSTNSVPAKPWDNTYLSPTTCIVSDDPDLTIAGITQSSGNCPVLNVSECTSSDLLTKINGRFDKLAFVFTETEQALLTALKSGQRVILTGHFSDELLDGLAPFLRQRAATSDTLGQLIIVSQQPIGFMDTFIHQVTPAEKQKALLGQGFTDANLARLQRETPSCMASQSFTTLTTRLLSLRAHPDKPSQQAWEGLSFLRPSVSVTEFNPDTSEQDSQAFLDARLMAFNAVIQSQPYVFLAGLTGVGKSRFVENELHERTIFHGEDAILAWIKTDPNQRPTLFMDEANLSTHQWSEFEGLFNKPPGLLYKGQYYPLTEQHKVIFAGNPLSYGDERKLAPLFARHGNSIVFEPLSNAFIYEKTLKPVLKDMFNPKDCELIGKELLRAYDFLISVSRDEILISPRQIQMMALAVIDYHVRFPEADLKGVAAFQARHMTIGLVPKQHIAQFNQAFPPIDRTELLQNHAHHTPLFKKFLATPSRDKALWQLTDFLSLRNFQRETDSDNPALRLGGLHRFVVEGEPGIGKSEMVIELMTGMGIHEAHLSDPPGLKINGFYRLSASMQHGTQEAILLKAFDEGAIVLIDEINSMPTLEKLLNSLLDGKHPSDANRSPLNPGFRVLGTQNPPTMAGRRLASPALENRTQTVQLAPYPPEEMDTILNKMGVTMPVERKELIDAFQYKVSEANSRHLTPAPSFRHFIHMAKQIVEGHARKHQTDNIMKIKEPDVQAGNTVLQTALKKRLQELKHQDEPSPERNIKPG